MSLSSGFGSYLYGPHAEVEIVNYLSIFNTLYTSMLVCIFDEMDIVFVTYKAFSCEWDLISGNSNRVTSESSLQGSNFLGLDFHGLHAKAPHCRFVMMPSQYTPSALARIELGLDLYGCAL
ncbi:unnamed protein product [Dovyalis caffra]|uniref:Uncharacterized protein n=1 Tax=Dovyalis caffra TaxID=77055 RepID=A0AAV1S7Q2_9ROSI|nr:unnamed protein product [Dovyalis caffra]